MSFLYHSTGRGWTIRGLIKKKIHTPKINGKDKR